jgi:hypothetical protein
MNLYMYTFSSRLIEAGTIDLTEFLLLSKCLGLVWFGVSLFVCTCFFISSLLLLIL